MTNIHPHPVKIDTTRPGDGKNFPKDGDTVVMHYTGKFTDGTKFDSSHDRGKPFTFKVGARQVISGWEEAVAQMSKGQHATLTIPPEKAYGAHGVREVIPEHATLVFDVELIDFH